MWLIILSILHVFENFHKIIKDNGLPQFSRIRVYHRLQLNLPLNQLMLQHPTIFFYFYCYYFFHFATPQGMWNLSSPTRESTDS